MPKIIENVKEQLLLEAKKQVFEQGYSATTIRSVASACNVSVGTVYNYFDSKEMLTATFVLENWMQHLQRMKELDCNDSKKFLKGIYELLRAFEKENEKIFSDKEATKSIGTGFACRHKMLRLQIASIIKVMCEKKELDNCLFVAEFIAEALLNWSMEDLDFEMIYPLLEKIIKK